MFCDVPYECSGTTAGSDYQDSEDDCRAYCEATSGCDYFSYYDTGLCLLFEDCDPIDGGDPCGDCTTSSVECACQEVHAECASGHVVGTEGGVGGQGGCADACSDDPDCRYYTYYYVDDDDDFCVLLDDCEYADEECDVSVGAPAVPVPQI